MTIRIGFLLLRDTFLKTTGNLIETCLSRGFPVTIFYDENAITGAKAYQKISPQKLIDFQKMGAQLAQVNLSQLADLATNVPIDILVTHEGFYNLKNHLEQVDRLRRRGIKVISLCHFFELTAQPLEALTYFDKTYYLSDYSLKLHFQVQAPTESLEAQGQYRPNFEVLGSPMFDRTTGLSKDACKKELGIPTSQPVVLLFAPVLSQVTHWRYYIWREPSRWKRIAKVLQDKKWRFLPDAFLNPGFSEILNSIAEFCKKNEAVLLIKSRVKQQDPGYMTERADLYFDGTEDIYYPVFSTHKLIAAADLCIGAMTMGIPESVAQSKPAVNVFIPPSVEYPREYVNLPLVKRNYLEAITNLDQDGPFNYSNALDNVERNTLGQWLADHELADLQVNDNAIEEYKNKILGITGETSSDRILDSMNALVSA
jgi:hypothetical protein